MDAMMGKFVDFVTCGYEMKQDFTPPESFSNMYRKGLTSPAEFKKADAEKTFAKAWNTHPNGFSQETPLPSGPGMEGAHGGIAGFYGAVMPDLKWTTVGTLKIAYPKKGLDLYVHLGTAYSKPKKFPQGGIDKPKGDFNVMAIDLHGVSKSSGLIEESWHIEEWLEATAQVQDAKPAVLHGGQDIGTLPKQIKMGKAIAWENAPECMRLMYKEFLGNPASVTEALTAQAMHEDWNSHPNALQAGADGPGSKGAKIMFADFFGKMIPDLKWSTLELFAVPCEGGVVYVHLGTGSGTPVGPMWGVDPPTGRSFNVMALDLHYVVEGRIKESWHVEEWNDAVQQLKGGPGSAPPGQLPKLHRSQPVGL